MIFDPFGTIGSALWIGGGQWAGKSTVARILATRHGLTAYHHDYAAAHGHHARRAAQSGQPFDAEATFVRPTPQEMATEVIGSFIAQFEWALDDLRALVSPRPVIAEGWGLRPDSVADIGAADRMVVMVPTEEFRQHQVDVLPRAAAISHTVSDPEKAQRNRIDRDRIVADDAADSARRLGIPVIEVDGDRAAEGVADQVAAVLGLTPRATVHGHD